MRTWLKVLLWVVGVLVLLGLVAVFVLFGPPKFAEQLAKPEFCARCHVMKPQYTAFKDSRHGQLESCNDCHLPNDGFVRHWFWDGVVGMRDVIDFNTNRIPARITATPRSKMWLRDNCVRCHVNGGLAEAPQIGDAHGFGQVCWRCHRGLYHDIQLRGDPASRRAIGPEE